MSIQNQISKLQLKQAALLKQLSSLMPLLPGSYNEVYRKCGKVNCWCQTAELGHPLKRICWREDGLSKTKAINNEDVQWTMQALKNYQTFQKLKVEIVTLSNEMKIILDELLKKLVIKTRSEKGW
jgi:hypothetical protein